MKMAAFSDELTQLLVEERSTITKKAMPSFLDELEKISAFEPGYVMGAGRRAVAGLQGSAARSATQAGQAAGALLTPRKSFRQGWNATFHPNGKPLGLGWKGFMGYGLYSGVKGALSKEDPSGRGQTRARRLIRLAGESAGGIVGAPYGLAGGITSSVIGSKVGDTVGAGLERLTGRRPQPHLPPPPLGSR